jgi:hypothetical protein
VRETLPQNTVNASQRLVASAERTVAEDASDGGRQMKMDPALIHRVLYAPGPTFQAFAQRPRYEAFAPVLIFSLVSAVRAYVGMLGEGATGAGVAVIGLVFVFMYSVIGMVAPPLMNATLVHILRWRVATEISFSSLFTAFVLCSLPLYLGLLLSSFSDRLLFGLGSLFPFVGESHSLLVRLLATITPYMLWTICLWWSAVTVLLNLRSYQRLLVVVAFVLLYAIGVQLLSHALVGFIHLA